VPLETVDIRKPHPRQVCEFAGNSRNASLGKHGHFPVVVLGVVVAVLYRLTPRPPVAFIHTLGMLKFNKCFPQTVFPVASFSRFLRSSVLVVQFFDALPRGVEVVAKICSW